MNNCDRCQLIEFSFNSYTTDYFIVLTESMICLSEKFNIGDQMAEFIFLMQGKQVEAISCQKALVRFACLRKE